VIVGYNSLNVLASGRYTVRVLLRHRLCYIVYEEYATFRKSFVLPSSGHIIV